jgi:hypothetical protein
MVCANPIPAPPIMQIYIRNDGSVDPTGAPIHRIGNIYTFTGDLTNASVEIQRDNIIIDGAGFRLQGNGKIWNIGIVITNRSNIMIENLNISNYWYSISLIDSSNIILYHNNMLTSRNIGLDSSSGNQIIENNISGQEKGQGGYCIRIQGNSVNNLVIGNNLTDAGVAVSILSGKNNTFYENNFLNNAYALVAGNEVNFLNSGQTGNYWINYAGTDADNNGIGDTPFIVRDGYLVDNYPLMVPYYLGNDTFELPDWVKSITSSAEPVNYTLIIAVGIIAAVIAAIVCSILWFTKSRDSRRADFL